MAEGQKQPKIIKPQQGGQDAFVRASADVVFFGGTLGGGKALSVNELVLTPNGWKRNGDLEVGELISTPFCGAQPVAAIYPQGVKDIYVIETTDGRKTQCTLDHLWEVRTKKQIYKYRLHRENKNVMVWTTQKILDAIKSGKELYIPTPHAQEFAHKKLPIDPYLMGVLLGDGCLTTTSKRSKILVISNSESDIVKRCADILSSENTTINAANYNKTFHSPQCRVVNEAIVDYGLNTYSYNRFIPDEYLFGSIAQRRQLLAGLFDTDGCVGEKNRYSFSTTSEKLKDGFVHLCRSLGYIAKVKEDRRPKYTDGHVAYDISICTFDKIFFSEKHTKRYVANEKKYKYHYHRTNDHVRIKSIEFKERAEALCIRLDYQDHLYIANDFMTTHNTFGAILASAEPSLDSNYRAVYFRRTLAELRGAGGPLDDFETAYGDSVSITKSENPRITFKNSGAWIELRQIADENPNKVRETFKGLQADAIFFEELTGFQFYTFNYLMSRARGKAKWTGKVRATTNPSKSHFVRKMVDWYIGADGFVIPERSGVIRYFYLDGDTVDDYVWGDSKAEVYAKCKRAIDRKLAKLGNGTTYENLIKSFTFILGNLSENTALLANNPDYVGNVSGREGDALLAGNWDVDLSTIDDAPIIASKARAIADNDPCMNGDKWITADLADVGNDNTIILAWNGLHIIDMKIVPKSTPKQNANAIKRMQLKHNVGDSHVIYDGQRATYMSDYIPDAVSYISSYRPRGLYKLNFQLLKDECYMRFVNAVNENRISMDEEVAKMVYTHQKIKTPVTVLAEFVDECSVVRFNEMAGGKMRLWTKKEMNAKLSHDGSMDITDACAERFLPCLACEYGRELEYGTQKQEADDYDVFAETADIYDDSAWC